MTSIETCPECGGEFTVYENIDESGEMHYSGKCPECGRCYGAPHFNLDNMHLYGYFFKAKDGFEFLFCRPGPVEDMAEYLSHSAVFEGHELDRVEVKDWKTMRKVKAIDLRRLGP